MTRFLSFLSECEIERGREKRRKKEIEKEKKFFLPWLIHFPLIIFSLFLFRFLSLKRNRGRGRRREEKVREKRRKERENREHVTDIRTYWTWMLSDEEEFRKRTFTPSFSLVLSFSLFLPRQREREEEKENANKNCHWLLILPYCLLLSRGIKKEKKRNFCIGGNILISLLLILMKCDTRRNEISLPEVMALSFFFSHFLPVSLSFSPVH